jgi:RimJ/RimL family protein N-acetyltransferase
MTEAFIEGVGTVRLRGVTSEHPRPATPNAWDDWGERDPAAASMDVERWLVDLESADGPTRVVGYLSSHAVWYGPTAGSRAVNIGISLVEDARGRGIGSIAQRLLAQHLHDRGVVRVEASTDVENIAEQRALARAGFVHEGTLRLAQGRADGLHDLQVWAHVDPSAGSGGR